MSEEKLTSQQVEQTLQYFDAFNQSFSQAGMPLYALQNRYYTPDMINSALKSLNTNPNAPSSMNNILGALANPNDSETILRNYAVYFEINNIFYKRLVNYNSGLLAWNMTFDCTNARTMEDYQSEQFKKDSELVDDFFSKYPLKEQGRIIMNQILRQGVYYGIFRDEGSTYCWQELPPDFCKITGNSNVGRLFDFDFTYFINNAGSNIDMFPKVFKKLYREIYRQIADMYNPKGKVDTRHSSWVYWINVSPRDNFFCFTLDDGINALIPYYSALFPDMYLQPMMRELEKNKAMISAQKVLVNLLDTYDKAKSGTVPNQYVVTPKDIGAFMNLVKSALGDVIKVTAIPAKSAQVVDFNVEAENRYTTYQENISANAVSSSASLLSENKLSVFEAELALNIDENFAKVFYAQMEKFLNYYINNRTEKYKFNFKLHDTNTKMDRTQRFDHFKQMAAMGLVDLNLYARCNDQNIFEAKRALQMSKAFGVEDLLIPLMSLNNQTAETGRPSIPDSNNENTVASIERGSNDLTE